MAESFDWRSIELPKGIDYDQLYDQLIAEPKLLDKMVEEFIQNDPKWIQRLRKSNESAEQIESLIKKIEENNKMFDQMMEEYHKSIINAKTTTITDTIYYDDEYTYYSDPIQRVIDIDELKQRMAKLESSQPSTSGLNLKTESDVKMDPNRGSVDTQTEDDEIIELSVVFEADNKCPKTLQPFIRTTPRVGDIVFAASDFILTNPWKPAVVTEIINPFNLSVKFDDPFVNGGAVLTHRLIAYNKPTNNPIPVGDRVVAYLEQWNGFRIIRELYSGTVAEPAKNSNDYRYLIFFDKHSYRYVKREDIFYIYDKIKVEQIFNEKELKENPEFIEYLEFLKSYFKSYPERPMLRLQIGDDRIKVRHQNKWESARVTEIDASLALIRFEKLEKPVTEWIYRGSRLLYDIHKEYQIKSNIKHRAGRSTARQTRGTQDRHTFLEWSTADDDPQFNKENKETEPLSDDEIHVLTKEEMSRKRKLKQTARKSTAKPSQASASCDPNNMISNLLGETIEIQVNQTPDKSLVKPRKYFDHLCSNSCIDSIAESNRFYDQNPFYIPIMVGYRRELLRTSDQELHQRLRVTYRAPCGRRLRDIFEVWHYLRITKSELDIDLFTFTPGFSLFRKSDPLRAKFYVPDITNGEEPQPISCVNTIDDKDLGPVRYKAERFPHPDVSFYPDPDFLSCCDCKDNCENVNTCSCQQLTLEASDAVRYSKHQVFGYEYKRLKNFVMTGIFECNQKCRCNRRCPNRVVQNGIKCRLQLFRTLKKGWGVRVLHDVPKGTFLCTYAAQILNYEAADKEGMQYGDEYLADLDYIDVCETQKEGYESDVEESEASDKDYKESESITSSDDEDDDFKCDLTNWGNKSTIGATKKGRSTTRGASDRGGDKNKSKKSEPEKKRYSIREDFFNEDFAYSLDAKKMGNIGRYLNHSCQPNCFVQNVFVDTHDLRFPWVSFFAMKDILAYEELHWDYNYQVEEVANRVMLCYCGASQCRRRLL